MFIVDLLIIFLIFLLIIAFAILLDYEAKKKFKELFNEKKK